MHQSVLSKIFPFFSSYYQVSCYPGSSWDFFLAQQRQGRKALALILCKLLCVRDSHDDDGSNELTLLPDSSPSSVTLVLPGNMRNPTSSSFSGQEQGREYFQAMLAYNFHTKNRWLKDFFWIFLYTFILYPGRELCSLSLVQIWHTKPGISSEIIAKLQTPTRHSIPSFILIHSVIHLNVQKFHFQHLDKK